MATDIDRLIKRLTQLEAQNHDARLRLKRLERATQRLPGDGVKDETDRINKELADHNEVELWGTHLVSDTITLTTEQRMTGRGELVNKTGDMIELNGRQISIQGVKLSAWVGHVFIPTEANRALIEGVQATTLTTDKSVWKQVEGDVTVGTTVHASTFEQAAGATAPLVDVLYTETGVFNHNSFRRVRFQSNGFQTNETTAPQVKLKRDYNNWIYSPSFIDCVFEVASAGAVHLYGTHAATLTNCTAYDTGYDTGGTTDHLWLLWEGSTGLKCRESTFTNVSRVGGALGTGMHDIHVHYDAPNVGHYSNDFIVDNCCGSVDVTHYIHSGFAAYIRGGAATIIDTP